jgi:hypothetical protein
MAVKTSLFLWGIAAHAASAAATYTNVNDVVLGLEFPQTSVVAGERLAANMIISNASSFELRYSTFSGRGARDTTIGDFVVRDESGYFSRKTVPVTEWEMRGSGRPLHFRPGHAEIFGGDVVYGYSLTNPGTYFIKAVAVVPTTNQPAPDQVAGETMVIETPAVEITVTPRPANMPPPQRLYPSIRPGQDLAVVHQAIAANMAAFPPLQVTHPKPNGAPQVPRAPDRRSAVPQEVRAIQDRSSATVAGTQTEAPVSRSSNVLYGAAVLLLLTGLGLLLRRSRTKERGS